jgi:type II secretory pathway pseudopilin PulG
MKVNKFTLIELLFVILILIILIGISWIASNKVVRTQNYMKAKSEIAMLEAAIVQYKDRWNERPYDIALIPNDGDSIEIDFFNRLDLLSYDDYIKNGFYHNEDGKVFCPYEQPYRVKKIAKDRYKVIAQDKDMLKELAE